MTAPRVTPGVIVTDGSYKHAVAIIRALGKSYRVGVTSHHALAPGFFSRFAKWHARTPNPTTSPSSFADRLITLATTKLAQIVVPVGFASSWASARHRDELCQAGLATVGPGLEQFEQCADKYWINEQAKRLGLNAPETVVVTDWRTVDQFLSLHDRVVLKGRTESSQIKPVSLTRGDNPQNRMFELHESEAIVQEWIPGEGRGYMALCDRGVIVREFAHRRLRELPASGGPATAAISVFDPSLMRAGRTLLSGIGWHGVAMVEFRSNSRGHYVIEVNPKFWGSLELALACGADFPGDYCRMAMGESLTERPLPPYTAGQRFWWPWRGDLRRLMQRPRDTPDVLADFISPETMSNWNWSDPLPSIAELFVELIRPLRRHE